MAYPYVPLIRHLQYGLKGKDVTAVQLALRHAKYRHRNPTGRYGGETRKEVKDFKAHHNIDREVGYDDKTHRALWPFFGRVAHSIYKEAYDKKHTLSTGQKVVNNALVGYNNKGVMHYTQDGRRMQDFACPPNVPNYTDCSGFATWTYKCGGAPDPNGFGYNGYGFTGTMLVHGKQVSLSGPLNKGDLIFYGHPVSHVAVYIGSGRVVSFGSEVGPLLLEMRYRSDINCARRYF